MNATDIRSAVKQTKAEMTAALASASASALPRFSGTVTAADVYAAAKETCSRLYILAGGSPAHSWTVQPYPGTAAITFERWSGTFTLCMPAMPLDARLTRREADLMTAYTVHELGHALFTDFEAYVDAARDGLGNLVNGLEDVRIEACLAKTARNVTGVTAARELLEMLTEYVTAKSLANGWTAANPASLPFTVFQIGAVRDLGYIVPSMPDLTLPSAVSAIVMEALDRLKTARNTRDTIAIARWMRDQLGALPKENAPRGPAAKPAPKGKGEKGEKGEGRPADDMRNEDERNEDKGEGKGEGEGEGEDEGAATAGKGADKGDAEKPQEAPGTPTAPSRKPDTGQGEKAPPRPSEARPEASGQDAGSQAWDPADAATKNPEVNLNEIGDRASQRQGKNPDAVARENAGITDYLNARECKVMRRKRLSPDVTGAASITAMIPTPAKLRRDITKALRSPELLATFRRETTGRFDIRDMSRMKAGAVNTFRKRTEAPGQETAVSLLLDMSSSMDGGPMRNAVALALHLGDACKACSVPFEVLGFCSPQSMAHGPTAHILEAKNFRDPWQEARPFVASMANAASGGTSMMPAMIDTSKRLGRKSGFSRRVMIVLTDGEDMWPRQSIRAAAQSAKARHGVETLMIGVQTNVAHLGLPSILVNDLRTLATNGLKALGEVLTTPSA